MVFGEGRRDRVVFGYVAEFIGSLGTQMSGVVDYDVCNCVSGVSGDYEDCTVSAAVYRL